MDISEDGIEKLGEALDRALENNRHQLMEAAEKMNREMPAAPGWGLKVGWGDEFDSLSRETSEQQHKTCNDQPMTEEDEVLVRKLQRDRARIVTLQRMAARGELDLFNAAESPAQTLQVRTTSEVIDDMKKSGRWEDVESPTDLRGGVPID